jgi:hypothetical protein
MTPSLSQDVELQPAFERLLRQWWMLVLMGLLGALAGFLFSLGRPAVFEAQGVLGVSLDYGVAVPLELVVEDRVLSRVASLLTSDSVLAVVLDGLPKEILTTRHFSAPKDLRRSLRLDRRLGRWSLVAADQDPAVARDLAAAWTEAAANALDQALLHAIKAQALMAARPMLVECVLGAAADSAPGVKDWTCSVAPNDALPDALAQQLQSERQASRGVLPLTSFELLESPTLPTEPVLWSRGTLVFAGAGLGLLAGLILVLLGWPRRIRLVQ